MAAAAPTKLTTQLQGGEQDVQNVDFITELTNAWTRVSNHIVGIQEATPLTLGEGGSQAPYKHSDYLLALGGSTAEPQTGHFPPKARFTCAINLAWVDFQWSATPGVPVRMAALLRLRDKLFKTPRTAPGARGCSKRPRIPAAHAQGGLEASLT